MIRPDSSATGMKVSGEMYPRPGWCHRDSASNETTLPVPLSTMGW